MLIFELLCHSFGLELETVSLYYTLRGHTNGFQQNGNSFIFLNLNLKSSFTGSCWKKDTIVLARLGYIPIIIPPPPPVDLFYCTFLNQLINQTSTAPISPAKPGSVARQPNQCSTAEPRKHFRKQFLQQIYENISLFREYKGPFEREFSQLQYSCLEV